jgi:GR25 family glycosyltransferase involved in LPS biosynthesis
MRVPSNKETNIKNLTVNLQNYLGLSLGQSHEQLKKLAPLLIDRLKKQDWKGLALFLERCRTFDVAENVYRYLFISCCLCYEILNNSQIEPIFKPIDYSANPLTLNPEGSIVCTMTSCKRLDLLERTIYSMTSCITDASKYIRKWYIVDDNSSTEDKERMQRMFPFATFIFKTPETKGHPRSMNIIQQLVKESGCPYHLHIEDDFEFFVKTNYCEILIDILEDKSEYGQALVNFEYCEDPLTAAAFWGQTMLVTKEKKRRYFLHQFFEGKELEKANKNSVGSQCFYWPHFSFRVGITRSSVYESVGQFDEKAEHFEMDYGYRYVKKKWKTAFMDGCYCTHIGRRTYERNTNMLNAYDLNEEKQFGQAVKKNLNPNQEKIVKQKEETTNVTQQQPSHTTVRSTQVGDNQKASTADVKMQMWLINLERRKDRLINFVKENHGNVPPFQVFKAVDGKMLPPSAKTQRMFETSDFHYRAGIVGCAYSHIKIWKEFLDLKEYDYALVVEDDAKFVSAFVPKLLSLIENNRHKFEIMFLQHHPWKHSRRMQDYLVTVPSEAEVWTRDECIQRSMGGTTAYVITRRGAANMLEHIRLKGVYNGIDWVMFKTASPQKDSPMSYDYNRIMYCSPFLCHADCLQSNPNADSDIQSDYSSSCAYNLKENEHLWTQAEISYWRQLEKKKDESLDSKLKRLTLDQLKTVAKKNNVGNIIEKCTKKEKVIEQLSKISELKIDDEMLVNPIGLLGTITQSEAQKYVKEVQNVKKSLLAVSNKWTEEFSDYIVMVPKSMFKAEDVNLLVADWYQTNNVCFVVPHKFLSQDCKLNKVWRNDYINQLCP